MGNDGILNIKLFIHLMPWELDNALLTFTQLKKSFYFLPNDVNVIIESVLNLSPKFVDWNKSDLPKEFFKSKYNDISILLSDYTHIKKVVEDDIVYGIFNIQKECVAPNIDYYIGICPDFYFSEHLLCLLIESARYVKNKYFVITPQIYKRWDSTWDEITDNNYMNVSYSDWDKYDVYKTVHEINSKNEDVFIEPVYKSKWATWFDLYNKDFYEELCPLQEHWNGYGAWDWYSMILTDNVKSLGVDFQQYILRGQTVLDMDAGHLKGMGFTSYYKKYLHLIPNDSTTAQRKKFESNMLQHLEKGFSMIKQKNIL